MTSSFLFTFIFSVLFTWGSSAIAANPCEVVSSDDKKSGFLALSGNTERKLYWGILPAKQLPRKGTVFFLAGGPLAHTLYVDLVKAYQSHALPHYDFVLYDYYGINCSDRAQDVASLPQLFAYFTMPQMAQDFLEMKKHLTKDEPVLLLGGSHGAMLGAQIIATAPEQIKGAILYSGDTKSGWLKNSWFRFDQILQNQVKSLPDFGQDLEALLNMAAAEKLSVSIDEQKIPVSIKMLEVIIWTLTSQDSAAQANLPLTIKKILNGDMAWLTDGVMVYYSLLQPVSAEPPPTYQTLVTNFHRCNVWMPKSTRISSKDTAAMYLKFESFSDYWNQLCADYDPIGEFPLSASVNTPTRVPVLVWTGDLDFFDPAITEQSWRQLSSQVTFHLKQGWSHDFGKDVAAGFNEVLKMIQDFTDKL